MFGAARDQDLRREDASPDGPRPTLPGPGQIPTRYLVWRQPVEQARARDSRRVQRHTAAAAGGPVTDPDRVV
jgi:hypothetical protein